MKKILFIVDDLGKGGAEKITLELAHTLAKNENLVTLAVLNSSKNTLAVDSSIEYIDLNINPKFAFGKLWKFKELSLQEQKIFSSVINEKKFDLIIVGFHNGYYLGKYLTQKKNIWYWVHSDLLEIRKFSNPFKQLKEYIRFFRNKRKFATLFKRRNIITVNHDLEIKAKHYTQPKKTITIANGVEIPKELLDKYKKIEKKWDVIFVGRLVKVKQVDHAIKAFSLSNLTGKMAIAGEGPERKKLETLTKELGISDRVIFLGWIDNPLPLILESSCLILSSYNEAFGLVLAESLCLGTPVVAYNSSKGVEDILSLQSDMKNFLVSLNDYNTLAKKIYECVTTPYPILNTTKEKLSINKTAEKFLTLAE